MNCKPQQSGPSQHCQLSMVCTSGFVTDRQAKAAPLTIDLQFPQSEVSPLARGALQLIQPSLTFANFMMPPDPELGVATRILLVWSPAIGQHDSLRDPVC